MVENVYEHFDGLRKREATKINEGPLTPSVPTYSVPTKPRQICPYFLNTRYQVKIIDFGESFLYKDEAICFFLDWMTC